MVTARAWLHGLRASRSEEQNGAEGAAVAVQMLAVLLHAGARPVEAWRHLAESGDPHAQRILSRTAEGESLIAAISAEGGAWNDLAAAWEVATTVGAPLADVLRALAETLRDAGSAADDVRIALAEPTGTARLLLWMPFAGLLLGFALGFDTMRVIFRAPAGGICVAAGLVLVLLARGWTRRLVRSARPRAGTPGMHAELVAVALSGGASIERALHLAAHGPTGGDEEERTLRVLELSRSAGVPAAELLRAAAAQDRHDSRIAGRLRAARLSTRLLLPLGVCTLPAFLLLGVAPLLLSVLDSTPSP